jgi:hypothetical protein
MQPKGAHIMADGQPLAVSGSDIESVAQKLKQFHDTLSPNEQIVLDWLMSRAAQAGEVEGYALAYDKYDQVTHFGDILGLGGPVNPATQYLSRFADKER